MLDIIACFCYPLKRKYLQTFRNLRYDPHVGKAMETTGSMITKIQLTGTTRLLVLIVALGLAGCEAISARQVQNGARAYSDEYRDDDRYLIARYEIQFGYDSATITGADDRLLRKIARDIAAIKPRAVLITGYTDRAGNADYNQTLSDRRARAVSNRLIKLGVPGKIMKTDSWGEDSAAIPTVDDVKFLENRRVTIDLRR